VTKTHNFEVGDFVVYPTHGVGKISSEEIDKYAGIQVKVYVITFKNSNMTLRIPKSSVAKTGLRSVCSHEYLRQALEVLSGKEIRLNKGMWSKRAQHYENKINSGNLICVAEVVKELHCNTEKSKRSYSERIIYNDALERLAEEYAVTKKVEIEEAITRINDKLRT